jgi:catechol 2,3-dioxygenase-like lactoylglutathione lyase family enzyme
MSKRSGLSQVAAHPVLRAKDLARAKAFYAEVLGLEVAEEPAPARELRIAAGDGIICIYERLAFDAPQNTVACFEVADIKAAVTELKARGVAFDDYNMPEMGLVTVDSVGEVNGHLRSWFRDSEGNVLVIAQRDGAAGG